MRQVQFSVPDDAMIHDHGKIDEAKTPESTSPDAMLRFMHPSSYALECIEEHQALDVSRPGSDSPTCETPKSDPPELHHMISSCSLDDVDFRGILSEDEERQPEDEPGTPPGSPASSTSSAHSHSLSSYLNGTVIYPIQDIDLTLRSLIRRNAPIEYIGSVLQLNAQSMVLAQDVMGNTCLHFAMTQPHVSADLVTLLCRYGARVNAMNGQSQTPLVVYLSKLDVDTLEVVNMLLHCGADTNICPLNGQTGLHLAVTRQLKRVSIRLLHSGASTSVKDREGVLVWEKAGPLKHLLLGNIRFAPDFVDPQELEVYGSSTVPRIRRECMACNDLFQRVGGVIRNCHHCGRICCANCTETRVCVSRFPSTFYSIHSAGQQLFKKRKVPVCRLCHDILSQRRGTTTGCPRRPFFSRLFHRS